MKESLIPYARPFRVKRKIILLNDYFYFAA
jgi:hypothetical protein